MNFVGEKVLLRVYLRSADRAPHTPTYQRVIKAARHEKLAGATVLKGILGAGYHGVLEPSAWSLVEHVPVIVEIVDDPQKIVNFVRGALDEIGRGKIGFAEVQLQHTIHAHRDLSQLANA